MKIHHVTMIIIAICILTLGMTVFIKDFGSQPMYGATIGLESFNSTEATLNDTLVQVDELRNSSTNFVVDISQGNFFDLPYDMIKTGWDGVKTFFGGFSTIGFLVSNIGNLLVEIGIPLPPYFIGGILGLLTIILIAIVLYGLYKWQFED